MLTAAWRVHEKQSADRKVDGRGQATAMSRHWAQVRQARLTPAQRPASCGTLHNDTMPEFPHLTNALDGEPPPTVPSRLPGSELHTLTAYHDHPRRKTQFPSLDNWQFPHQASLVAQTVKTLPAMLETQVRSLSREDPLEKGMATYSSILAWRIPWTEEPGRLQSMESQRVRHDEATDTFTSTSSLDR